MSRRTQCRVCEGTLAPVLDLGSIAHCSFFPLVAWQVERFPLLLAHCASCGLTQLGHDTPLDPFGPTYGYRSGLNASMAEHLRALGREAYALARVEAQDVVLDIGGNDGTLLAALPPCRKILIDPTAFNWPPPSTLDANSALVVVQRFSAQIYRRSVQQPAKLVFSIAMFYDLDDPVAFARDVESILAPDGVWVLEQSYLPSMLSRTAFDTICHEHLEYYSLTSLAGILERAGLKILRAELNEANGGSLRLYAGKRTLDFHSDDGMLSSLEALEQGFERDWRGAFEAFAARIQERIAQLKAILREPYAGFGASTKGNTLLQVAGLHPEFIVDVNPAKWGRVTPGTNVPIMPPGPFRDGMQYLVLPWHFKQHILIRQRDLLERASLVFPLPVVEQYGKILT